MKKEIYTAPEIQILNLQVEDIITTSGDGNGEFNEDGGFL